MKRGSTKLYQLLKGLPKQQILRLARQLCPHHRPFLEHPACLRKELGHEEKIGFLDIEASGLQASFSFVFSYCIKELNGKMIERVATSKEIKTYKFDRPLMEQLCKDIRKFERIIVYYGKNYRYDIPFLRTRALYYKLDFPTYSELIVNDLFDTVKSKLRLHRNRLETACEFFSIPCKGHRLNPIVWQRAQAGNKESLQWILEHNREDAISLELLWKKLNEFTSNPKTSI